MPYVARNRKKDVVAITVEPDDNIKEYLEIDHPDVIDFLTRLGTEHGAKELLNNYDAHVPRVLEDLIDILIRNHIITFEQFPGSARQKLITRQYLRNLIRQEDRS